MGNTLSATPPAKPPTKTAIASPELPDPPAHQHNKRLGPCRRCWWNAGRIATLAQAEEWLRQASLEPNAQAWIRKLIDHLRATT